VLGELLEHLPDSFEGLHVIPALEALRHLPDPPDSLADDLWARVRGTMTARATQDLLFALAPIRTRGIPSVIARLARSPDFLPSFHLIQFVGLYQKWKAATGLSFQVRNGSEDVEFIEWLLLKRLPGHSSDPFFGTELGRIAEILVPILLEHFEDDEDEYLQFIVAAQQVPRFHARVVERMLGRSDYAPLIPKVFANAFDTFPDAVLVRVLESPAVDFGAFIRALSQSPTPMHRNVHSRTISRLLERAFDIFEYRSVAQALRNYPRWTLQQVLKEVLHGVGDRELLLIREVEKASGELLVDESGKWLA
jgi:hypothetical protein